ncbi:MAG: Ger(x)C family spore germination protein [Firmicutes bacterium]|nr:Ger(x)C family spore germination protein [Bacillota bacterium]
MKSRSFTAYLLSGILLCCFLLTGCTSGAQIDQLAIVMGVGIDKGSAPDNYLVTAQIARPSHVRTANEGGAAQGKPYLDIQQEGKGISMAMYEMMRQMSRRAYLAHNEVIVISEDVAAETILPILDYFIRSLEAKFTVDLVIARGTASGLLAADSNLEQMPAKHLQNLLENQVKNASIEEMPLYKFLSDMLSPGIAPTIPIMELYTDETGIQNARVQGAAVFDGGTLAGTLSAEQTRTLQLVRDKVKSGYINLDAFGSYVSLDITHSKTSVTPRVENGRVIAKIRIRQEYILIDTGVQADITTEDAKAQLERLAAMRLIQSVESLLQDTKAQGLDVCGFGQMAYRKYPRQVEALLETWPEQYKALEVEYDVETVITITGSILRPMAPKGGEQ